MAVLAQANGGRRDQGSASDRVYSHVRSLLIDQTLAPGTAFTERELASRLSVTIPPVRAALRRLMLEGLVYVTPRRGYHVVGMSAADSMDVFVVWETLSECFAETTAELLTGQEPLGELNGPSVDVRQFMTWHGQLIDGTGNRALSRVFSDLAGVLERYLAHAFSQMGDFGRARISESWECVCSADSHRARVVAYREHLRLLRICVEESLV